VVCHLLQTDCKTPISLIATGYALESRGTVAGIFVESGVRLLSEKGLNDLVILFHLQRAGAVHEDTPYAQMPKATVQKL